MIVDRDLATVIAGSRPNRDADLNQLLSDDCRQLIYRPEEMSVLKTATVAYFVLNSGCMFLNDYCCIFLAVSWNDAK
jgi:hypothetical protein